MNEGKPCAYYFIEKTVPINSKLSTICKFACSRIRSATQAIHTLFSFFILEKWQVPYPLHLLHCLYSITFPRILHFSCVETESFSWKLNAEAKLLLPGMFSVSLFRCIPLHNEWITVLAHDISYILCKCKFVSLFVYS